MNEVPQHNTQTPENNRQKVWRVLENVDVGNDLLVRTLITQEIKPTIEEWYLMESKSCCKVKETYFYRRSSFPNGGKS